MLSFPFLTVVAIFITCLLTANITLVKQITVAGLTLPAAIVIFPISYICGDVLTEVYGYRQARRIIWLGFFCNLIMVAGIWLGQVLPPAAVFEAQGAYERILGKTPAMLAASFAAYLAGEFINAFVLAKLKIATRGRWLWTRTIGSTLVGQGVDTVVVLTVASILGVIPGAVLGGMIVAHWLVKCSYEAAATPLTYKVVNYLKRREGLDTFDYDTRFNPLRIAD
ncbi:MAG TPA: queuosine precursor transporter [Dehalococcoidia bacterium]|nr:queuosine precursor transporter [Dehalococcoidia bacterium]